ncbi:phosphoribosylanthranilate isomerase [Deinococcus sonorensis]|uniref:N-(5'-phosphoribosyl)anthranilate isomerase n=2 Tax=Deinococcus sonorensis TaxID=309891 RepID=A0AAU7UER6_9DEIO
MTRVKICGTTTVADGMLAAEAGADAIGLIFAPVSRRQVDVQTARQISLAVGPAVGRVGVFLDQPLDEVLRLAAAARVSAVQIHGRVSSLYLETLACYHPVLRVLTPAELAGAGAPPIGHTLMLDAPTPGQGVPLDWEALRPGFLPGSWLAGGLGPENVKQAIQVLQPAGVDAVSRLEMAPGHKDPARVRAFIQAVKMASWSATNESYPQ